MKILTLSVTAFLLAMTLALHASAEAFEGTWSTSFGTLKIQKNPGEEIPFICGTYENVGYVAGYVRGNEARGVFVYADQSTGKIDAAGPENIGTFKWRLQNDAKFVGHWSWGKASPTESSDRSWKGRRTSIAKPSFSRNGVLWDCTRYLRSMPDRAVLDWLVDVDGSQFVNAPRNGTRYSSQNILLSYVASRENLAGFQNCNMGNANPDILWCDVLSRGGARHALDLRLCVVGTISSNFTCTPPLSGSFKSSCRAASNKPTPASKASASAAKNRVIVDCKGPEWSRSELRNRTDYVVDTTRFTKTEYVPDPKNGFHYRNTINPTGCPTWKYWNQNGTLRCVSS